MQYVKKVNSLRHGTKRPDMNQWDEAYEWETDRFKQFLRTLIPPDTRKGKYLDMIENNSADNISLNVEVEIDGTEILRLRIKDPLRIEELAEWENE